MFDKHEDLLGEWAKQYPSGSRFIKDGIIEPTRWELAKIKVLFLLRQGYDWRNRQEDADLRQDIRDWKSAPGKTLGPVARWAYGIHNASKTSIPPLNSITSAAAYDSLLASAIVNVKKVRGVKVSIHDDLNEYAIRDSDFIRRQLDIIDPTVVVCGGTLASLWLCPWFKDAKKEIYDGVFVKIGNRFYFHHAHPSSFYPKEMKYYFLLSIVQQSGVLNLNPNPTP